MVGAVGGFNARLHLLAEVETEGAMLENYRSDQVLFRFSKELMARAERAAADHRDGAHPEPRNREADYCLGVVVMTHAALESWLNRTLEQYGVDRGQWPRTAWHERWELGVVALARARNRETRPSLPTDIVEGLADMNAMRNYPVHADARARERLRVRVGDVVFPELLSVAVVGHLLTLADRACRWAEELTGEPAPRLEGAWVGC